MKSFNPEMQYRPGAGGDMLSVLGYGCMRFTKKGGAVDLDKAERELMYALDGGVNYLDTAYIYSGNEAALGKIFERTGCRERVYLATKLPQYLVKTVSGAEKIFNEELDRLKTAYFDYYLMHMITDIAQWEKLERMGIREWIDEKKKSGKIRHIGFSFHGNTEMFLKVLAAYEWDFCQIQYNYMDEHAQAGRIGLEAAQARGIPVVIMEPLRGGRLVNMLPKGAVQRMKEDGHRWTPAQWGLHWLWNQGGVSCVLSGMNDMQMVEENLAAARESRIGLFGESEFALIDAVRREISAAVRVGCTGCGYCMPCPKGVDIPGTFRCLNEIPLEGRKKAVKEYWQVTALKAVPGSASRCIGCGKCEKHCPQEIPIREMLKVAAKELETPFYKVAGLAMRVWSMRKNG